MILILLNIFCSIAFSRDISVLVIDTGVDTSHEEIKSHIPKSEDLNSFNYKDTNSHGTHIAGLILKNTCYRVKLYSCKYHFEFGEPKIQNANDCFDKALVLKPDYVNFSSGGKGYDIYEKIVIEKILKNGTKVVVSAGNDGENNPLYYPPAYGLKNLIIVGNLDEDRKRHKTSNYGFSNMVWEIGTKVFSTLPNGNFGQMTGTSQATAIRTNRLLRDECDRN